MILEGNALHVLKLLPPRSIQTCVTSPPYWGLRDYGDPGQDWPPVECSVALGGVSCPVTVPAMTAPLGLESKPIEYIAHLVAIFREVRRVLADNGTLWLNLGDTYNSSPSNQQALSTYGEQAYRSQPRRTRNVRGLKTKDLVGIPWLAAFALRSDGWYLRSDIIWHKRNPMPESVTDRCTSAHEYLFQLTKSPRYTYHADAIREPYQSSTRTRNRMTTMGGKASQGSEMVGKTAQQRPGILHNNGFRNKRTVWSLVTRRFLGAHFAVMPPKLVEPCILAGSSIGDRVLDPFAGSATVGEVATKLGREFVGIELSPEYAQIARQRVADARASSGLVTATEAKRGQQMGLLFAPKPRTPCRG